MAKDLRVSKNFHTRILPKASGGTPTGLTDWELRKRLWDVAEKKGADIGKLLSPKNIKELQKLEMLRRAAMLKNAKGLALTRTLAIPGAAVAGFVGGDALMNYAAENMGIPQTIGMAENQAQDTLNLMRRRAILQGAR